MKTTMEIEAEWWFMKKNAFGLKKIRSEMAEYEEKTVGINVRGSSDVNSNFKFSVE